MAESNTNPSATGSKSRKAGACLSPNRTRTWLYNSSPGPPSGPWSDAQTTHRYSNRTTPEDPHETLSPKALMAMAPNTLPSPPTNKRKRESIDHEGQRPPKSSNTNGDSGNTTNDEDINLRLLQGLGEDEDENTRTAQAALATPLQNSTYPQVPETSFDSATGMHHGLSSFDDSSNSPPTGFSAITPTAQLLSAARDANTPMNHNKPAVGTPQWHQQRKDNHKEVERRRRETINEGINELAKVVPGSEKNKGAILQAAVDYIGQLLAKEHSWNNERATLDVAIKELVNRSEKMKENAEQAWAEAARWQKRCREARLLFDDYDDGALHDGEEQNGLDV